MALTRKISLLLVCGATLLSAGGIRINQLGYFPTGAKVFVVTDAGADSFAVHSTVNDSVVLRGALGTGDVWTGSNESAQQGDFSALTAPGQYVVEVVGMGRSEPFRIRQDLYAQPYVDIQRAFYYWRASAEIPAQYGGTFARPFGHPDSSLAYHDSLHKEVGAKRDVRGGWYDAGDYGKYVVNAGMTMGLLQMFQSMYPNISGDSVMNIPESKNGRPDLLDETRYELDWLLRMQDSDGGVFFKVTPKNFEAMVLPSADYSARLIIGKTTASTLDFAAMVAQAARRWVNIDSVFADSLVKASKAAYAWALLHPSIQYLQSTGNTIISNGDTSTRFKDVNTGGYGDNYFKDEKFWASSELWLTTGDSTYKPNVNALGTASQVDWPNVWTMGLYSLALDSGVVPDAALQAKAQSLVKAAADYLKTSVEANPYRVPDMIFYWGSNGAMASNAMNLLVAFHYTQDTSYVQAAVKIADYFFGKNPLDLSFITGIGTRYSKMPHSRIMVGDKIVAPIPGYVVGGPNESVPTGDPAYKSLVGCVGALCYSDIVGSYSTNEIAINWQAPVTALIGSLQAILGGANVVTPELIAPSLVVDASEGGHGVAIPAQASYSIGDSVRVLYTRETGKVFLGTTGAIAGVTLDTTIVISRDTYVKGWFATPKLNVIKNSKMNSSIVLWQPCIPHENTDGTAAETRLAWVDSTLEVWPVGVGNKVSDVYAFQNSILLGQGKMYQVDFIAHSPVVRTGNIAIYANNGKVSLAEVQISYGPKPFHYRWTFTYPGALDLNASLRIGAGLDTGKVYLDNVTLRLITDSAMGDIVTKTRDFATVGGSLVNLNGHWLDFASEAGSPLRVEVYSLQGALLGSWDGISAGSNHLDLLGVAPAARGVSIVRVSASQQTHVMRWIQ